MNSMVVLADKNGTILAAALVPRHSDYDFLDVTG